MHSHAKLLRAATALCVLGFALACTPSSDNNAAASAADTSRIRQDIDTTVVTLVENTDAIRSAVFSVKASSSGFEHQFAAGNARAGAEQPMTADHPFMIASISKTIIAARILQMSETGDFALDDPLSDLAVFPEAVIAKLHRIEGKSFGDRITIRQLLQHTSGLKDYLLDDRDQTSAEADAGVAPGSLAGIWQSQLPAFLSGLPHPDCGTEENCKETLYPAKSWKHWDADAFAVDQCDKDAGLLNFYLSEMADSALFPPGEGAHYSDTNYLLLGLLIEAISGETLDRQLRTHIFEPFGMSNSYMSYARGHELVQDNVSDWYAYNIPMVSAGADVSWDWAGGGIVTTARDLQAFITALMSGKLFEQPETLEAMLDPIRLVEKDGELIRGYGLGIRFVRTELGPTWGHTGAWGAQMHYFVDHDIAVVGTVNDYGSIARGEQTAIDIAKLVSDLD